MLVYSWQNMLWRAVRGIWCWTIWRVRTAFFAFDFNVVYTTDRILNSLISTNCFDELFVWERRLLLTIRIMVIFIITRQTQTKQKKTLGPTVQVQHATPKILAPGNCRAGKQLLRAFYFCVRHFHVFHFQTLWFRRSVISRPAFSVAAVFKLPYVKRHVRRASSSLN